MERLTPDDQSFLNDLRQNALLEREEAYHKINFELEKKTSAIIEKIEKYSAARKAKQTRLSLRACPQSLDLAGSGDGNQSSETLTGRKSNPDFRQYSEATKNESFELITLFEGGDRELRRTYSATSTTSSPPGLIKGFSSKTRIQGRDSSKTNSVTNSGSNIHALSASELRQQTKLQKATESVVNCLQSKLTNYEGRLMELHLQHRQKIQENTMLESKVRALEDERERLLRTVTSLQNSIDKQSKMLENTKSSASNKSQVVESMRKEIEALKKEQKQSKAQMQSLLTRLNRTTEENEKLKAQNKSTNLHLRELQSESRTKAEEQNQRILNLEQERGLLSSTVAKQAHLLKNLTNQRRHDEKPSKLFS